MTRHSRAAYLPLGYNGSRHNVALVEREGTTRLVRTDELGTDGRQLIVKFSYLLRR